MQHLQSDMSTDVYSFSIGTVDCWALSDGQFNYPTDAFFANASPEELMGASDRYEVSARQVATPYTCLYLEIGSEQILIDAGAGPVGAHASEIFPEVDHTTTSTGHLPENLRAIGTAPSAIDTVVLTHAHPDHVGGLLDEEGGLVFGNAQYVISKTEWQFWFAETAAEQAPPSMVDTARRTLGVIEERVHLIEPEAEIRPGIRAMAAPGHTPGHIALSITFGGEQLLHMADLVLHPLLMARPDGSPALISIPNRPRRAGAACSTKWPERRRRSWATTFHPSQVSGTWWSGTPAGHGGPWRQLLDPLPRQVSTANSRK